MLHITLKKAPRHPVIFYEGSVGQDGGANHATEDAEAVGPGEVEVDEENDEDRDESGSPLENGNEVESLEAIASGVSTPATADSSKKADIEPEDNDHIGQTAEKPKERGLTTDIQEDADLANSSNAQPAQPASENAATSPEARVQAIQYISAARNKIARLAQHVSCITHDMNGIILRRLSPCIAGLGHQR